MKEFIPDKSLLFAIPQQRIRQINTQFPVSLSSRTRFAELELFLRQIEQSRADFYHQPYTSNKKNALIYKVIFFSFALLFALLCLILISVSFVHSYGIFNLSSVGLMKGVIASVCSLLAIASFSIALTIRTEKEAIFACVNKARAQIDRLYARKRVLMGANSFIALFGHKRRLTISLNQAYREACDRINDKKEEALHLAHRIMTAEILHWNEKEALLNQAIEDLNEKLLLQVHTFKRH